MNHKLAYVLAVGMFAGCLCLLAGEKPGFPAPVQLSGATLHPDLVYLPEGPRRTGDASERKDYQITLDLWVPDKGEGPFPVLVVVHGGSFEGGDKRVIMNYIKPVAAQAVAAGVAVASINYILAPKGYNPQQVYDDFHDACRFLRANAGKYRLDPTRFGATGFSAGGWLITRASIPSGDICVFSAHHGMTVGELASDRVPGKDLKKPRWMAGGAALDVLLLPVLPPAPAWPGVYGRIQAYSGDFLGREAFVCSESPAIDIWGGAESGQSFAALAGKVGARFSVAKLVGPYFREHPKDGSHVPKIDTPALSLDETTEVTLAERVWQFFERELLTHPRTPAPEIHPGLRVFGDGTEVAILVPAPTLDVRYTTDGSAPTETSPRYRGPFVITTDTVVKAIAFCPGRPPSGIAIGTFLKGPVPPRVTTPDVVELPAGTVGKTYSVQFLADLPAPLRWEVGGEFEPGRKKENGQLVLLPTHGMSLDPATGVFSGVPASGGVFWLQVRVGRGPGQLAGLRDYRWTVHGTGAPPAVAVQHEDPFRQIGTGADWTETDYRKAENLVQTAGLRLIGNQRESNWLLLTDKAQVAEVRNLLQQAVARQELKPIDFNAVGEQ